MKLSPNMPFNDFCVYWLNHTNDIRSISTNAKYEEIITRILYPVFKDKKLNEINTDIIQKFLDSLKVKGLQETRVSMIRAVITMITGYAANHNLIARNPGLLAYSDRRKHKNVSVLNDDEIKILIDLRDKEKYVRLMLVTLFLGLRIGEGLGLSWNKIDMENKNVEISQQIISYYKDGKTIQSLVPYTKNKSVRVLPIHEAAFKILEEQREQYIPNENNLVFTEDNGNMILYATFYYQFNKIMNKLGRPDITPHSLRHTAATTLLYESKDILLVKEVLGHNSIRTTEIYPTISLRERQEIAMTLDKYFAPYIKHVFPDFYLCMEA